MKESPHDCLDLCEGRSAQRQERGEQGEQERRSGESVFSHYNHAPGNCDSLFGALQAMVSWSHCSGLQ